MNGGGKGRPGRIVIFFAQGKSPGTAHAALHRGWIQDGQDTVYGIHDVAGHIAQGPRTVGPPAAPVPGQILFVVRYFGRGAEPEVKIQFLRNRVHRVGRDGLWPHGTISPAKYLMYLADNSRIIDFFHAPYAIARPALIAHLGDYFVFFGRLPQHPCFVNIVRQGLLGIHVLA